MTGEKTAKVRQGLVDASAQHGLVCRKEALKFLTRRQLEYRLETGQWVKVFPNVYRIEGAPQTWRQRVEALSLWLGSKGALSHRTAAALHGFPGFADAEPLEATVTKVHRRTPAGTRLMHITTFGTKDLGDVDGLSVTNPTTTLVDLAPLLDVPELRAAVDHALRHKQTTLEKLRAAYERAEHRRGRATLGQVLHELEGGDGPSESQLEQLGYEVIESAGLPRPVKQRAVYVGKRFRRLDLCYVAQRVVIELDGYAHHSGVDSFEDDRDRNNKLTAQGFLVLHWTWSALHQRPEELLLELLGVLERRASAAR